jgi:DNA mismatch repair protein MutL
MSDIIHLLPDFVSNQIAAGEVIQRPASVLKELVENSIDAGATFIQIVIKDAGRTLVQIVDNGKGMSETDARMAFERHATSKIKDAGDLFSLKTMGFRGEALASIAAVAQVELRTKRFEDELGVYVEIAGTRVFKQEMIQCDTGTSFLIKNLFFNVPARRRFLKSDNVEKGHILTEFYRIVLVNPSVSFSFFDGDEELFHLPSSNYKIRIENVFGKNSKKRWQQQLLTIETITNLVSIHGYIGKPEYAQKSAVQYFFVNGRYMRHPYFHKAVLTAYNQMIQATESPNYFIYLEVDPQTIDVNIHPTKTEIKFENEQAIWSILSASIKESLGKFNIVPSIDFDQEGSIDLPVGLDIENVRPPQTNFNPSFNPFNISSSNSSISTNVSSKRPVLNWESLYDDFEKKDIELTPTLPWVDEVNMIHSVISPDNNSIIDANELCTEKVQVNNKYILCSINAGLLLIDQQKAHVRILFDLYMHQITSGKSISQQVLFPEELVMQTHETLIFEQILDDLESVGFEFEFSCENTYSIKGIPSHFGSGSVVDLLFGILKNATVNTQGAIQSIHESLSLSLSQTSCIKSGKSLSMQEMNDLVVKLFACDNHSFTPDGKKIMSIIGYDEIDKYFR